MKDLSFEARLYILLAVMAVIIVWIIYCVFHYDCPDCQAMNAYSFPRI